MTCGFQPVEADLIVTTAPGAVDTRQHRSVGMTDGLTQICDADMIHDSTHIYEQRFTDRMVEIVEWSGTAWVEVLKITFDSFTATEFKYNVITAGANAVNYQLLRKVRG